MKKGILTAILMLMLAVSHVNAGEARRVMYSGHSICNIAAINNTRMIPVRSVAEALGYKVEWLPESKEVVLSRRDLTIDMKISHDSYNAGGINDISLGAAPIISNGSTYVPLTLLTELMQEKTVYENEAVTVLGSAVITSVGSNSITIEDSQRGEILLHIDDYITITDENGKILSPSRLVSDTSIYVDYGAVTTMSLPPSNTPTKIIIYN